MIAETRGLVARREGMAAPRLMMAGHDERKDTMPNALKSYVRKTMMNAAREYAYPKARRTPESTKSAFMDAMRGTDTGWWHDLIYTAPMLAMAHKYRRDIATALAEYRDSTGESFVYRQMNERDISAESILSALLRGHPFTLADYHDDNGNERGNDAEAALTGLRFAVEWYAGELARDYVPDL